MATPTRQLDQASLREQVLDIVRGLLVELGSQRALESLRGNSHLDRDLGLGSLERVELLLRLGSAFGTHLPDRVMAEADTVDDLVAELLRSLSDAPELADEDRETPAVFTEPAALPAARRPTEARGVESAETFVDVLEHRARVDAHQPNILLREDPATGSEQEQVITFGDLWERAGCVARGLARRGVAPGDTVAIMLPTCREFFYTFAGVLRAGAVPVPLYPPFRVDRIGEYAARQAAILRNARAKLLVTFRQAEAVARLLKPRVRSLVGVVNAARLVEDSEPEVLPRLRVRADALALLQYTSGSTGEPKGVMLTHANLLANLRAIGAAVEIRADDMAISWLPLYHDMGLIGAWMMPLYFGIPVAVLSPLAFLSRPERWLWAVHQHRGTLSAAPNFAYELCVRKIADCDIEGLDLSSWRGALNGAEPVSPETLERFAERFAPYGFRRAALLPVYGLAEASLAVTVPPMGAGPRVDRIERAAFEREGRAVPAAPEDPTAISFVSVGRPVPGHDVRIVDANSHEAGERVEGALWFRGPSATRGYYRNPEATRALFPGGEEGWVDSGDRAYCAAGEIYVTGRVKDIIIKAGRNLYPHEIEELVAQVSGVRRGCVVAFGVPDEASGTERLVVVAETREPPAGHAPLAARVTEEVTTVIGQPPDIVELLPPHSIPKTSSGKLRRAETRKMYVEGILGQRKPPAWLQVTWLGARAAGQEVLQRFRSGLEMAYGVYAGVAFALWLLPTWFLVWLAPSRRAAATITSRGLRVYMALVGCHIRVRGREYLEGTRPLVFVSNHTSYFDVLALMAALGIDYRFVAKIEVRFWPFIGTFMRKLGHLAFDRSDPRARLRQAEEIELFLRSGESVFVFPEGTFQPHEGVRPFQLGAFKAAVVSGRPVCPVALQGTRRFLRDETWLPRPTRVTITLCPPLWPERSASADWHEIVRLRDASRALIAQHCGEHPL